MSRKFIWRTLYETYETSVLVPPITEDIINSGNNAGMIDLSNSSVSVAVTKDLVIVLLF